MAVYAIGDIHGCYAAFRRLLEEIQFNPQQDQLWLVGDLVNRGEESLAVLRWVYDNRHCLTTVLGNHDLHLLAVAAGAVPLQDKDTIGDILNADDGMQLCEWLRRQPLAHYQHGWLLLHAGVLPLWDTPQILRLAKEVQQVISGEKWHTFAAQMYGNTPNQWQETLTGGERWRIIINALTRLRICSPVGELYLKFSGTRADIPAGYLPWFEAPQRKSAAVPIVCGHWSALAGIQHQNMYNIDSGCLWDGKLTALRLADRQIFQVGYSAAAMPTKTNKPNH